MSERKPGEPFTLAEVTAMRDKAAKIVMDYGEVYLPIFVRLDQEAETMQAKQSALDRVRMIVQKQS